MNANIHIHKNGKAKSIELLSSFRLLCHNCLNMPKTIIAILFSISINFFLEANPSLLEQKKPPTYFEDFIKKAKAGDFIVTEMHNLLTVIHIHSIKPHSIFIEEISIPKRKAFHQTLSWKDWVQKKAPGHSSWSMLEIDMKHGKVLDSYSFSNHSHMQLTEKESLFACLFKLPLIPVADAEKKRIGPSPPEGEPDFRKIWNPPLFFEGKKQEKAEFDVFETTWPQDGSELSLEKVILYFDHEFSLPYWIQISTTHFMGNIRVIDSGKNLKSPYQTIPRSPIQFLGKCIFDQRGALFLIKCPQYCQNFSLFAVDLTVKEKPVYPVNYEVVHSMQDQLTILVKSTEFEDLQKGHQFYWMILPIDTEGMASSTSPKFLLEDIHQK